MTAISFKDSETFQESLALSHKPLGWLNWAVDQHQGLFLTFWGLSRRCRSYGFSLIRCQKHVKIKGNSQSFQKPRLCAWRCPHTFSWTKPHSSAQHVCVTRVILMLRELASSQTRHSVWFEIQINNEYTFSISKP